MWPLLQLALCPPITTATASRNCPPPLNLNSCVNTVQSVEQPTPLNVSAGPSWPIVRVQFDFLSTQRIPPPPYTQQVTCRTPPPPSPPRVPVQPSPSNPSHSSMSRTNIRPIVLCRTFLANREAAVDFLNTVERIYVVDGYANWDPNVSRIIIPL